MFACLYAPEHAAALAPCAQAFSPRVEETAPGIVVADIDGLERLFGGPHEIAAAMARHAAAAGIRLAGIAIASNPDAAVCAARGFAGVSIVPEGDEAKFLGSLPLALLDPEPEIAATLARWGIRKFRDLAALPDTGLVARLGPEALRQQRLARGAATRPLVPAEEPLDCAAALEFEHPVELLEPLSFPLARLLNELVARLSGRALAIHELTLRLGLEDASADERTLKLPVPMLDARALLKLMQLNLAARPPRAPVVGLRLEAAPVKPRVAQAGLFLPLAPEPEKLEITLARLAALAGEGNVGSPELPDTHRPGAFHMRRFGAAQNGPARAPGAPRLALRVFRSPRAARVETLHGRPAHVAAEGIRGSVTACAGPWRTSGDWWTPAPWGRDEWEIALAGGALYRLTCDHATGRWFVDGCYD